MISARLIVHGQLFNNGKLPVGPYSSLLVRIADNSAEVGVTRCIRFMSAYTVIVMLQLTEKACLQDIIPPNDISDEEAYAILHSLDISKNRLGSDPEGIYPPPVWRISPDTVLKRTDGAHFEPFTMLLVSTMTTIPVPRVRKYVTWNSDVWVFMEYIGGRNLEEAWPSLSVFKKLWIIWKLRDYVHQLRRIPLAEPRTPGPVDGSGKPQRCIGYYFTELSAGPFASYAELTAWYDKRAEIAVRLNHLACEASGKAPSLSLKNLVFDDSAPLVLTHGDITPRNVILGDDGRLWLVDWGFSGVYPSWLEYACMAAYRNASAPRLWRWSVPLVTGWYPSQLSYLQALGEALMLYDI